MTDSATFNHMIEIMLTEDDDSLDRFMLLESEKDTVLAALGGDPTLINYMMLFEEFLENHDLYLFEGWSSAAFVGKPKIEKFWATFALTVNEGTDMRGAKRVNDAMPQGQVKAKAMGNGKILVVFQVLKRHLDQIEETNREKIEELSDQALEQL